MADYQVSKLMWMGIIVALAASVFVVAKPQISSLTNGALNTVSKVVNPSNSDNGSPSNSDNGGSTVTKPDSNDPKVTHTAYSWSSDGTDRFTTTKPNSNLLDGTKDFSGNWEYSDKWTTDGTYKGLTVKKRTTDQWFGIYRTFIAPKDGTYTFSAYIKSSGNTANIMRFGGVNTTLPQDTIQKYIGNNFDWTRDSVTLNLKANDSVWIRYEISGTSADSVLWTAGHKWEQGSVATPYMPSASDVKPSDQPKYIGTYTDKNESSSQDPSKYTWKLNPDYHE